ncbi:hypothetical protein CONLIGDRAFT_391690 [Coniochaeta ligniaria NRRL 30616]|uniref:Uncharacterized protein n=1 Tax=Coniochaeta ligniaria NRRL 30616 TaxID=1408157 RepID=A0A1J7JHL3_9PEZI|nr:hypothetical protein CONLIGDRAFT_391690 [Coniochaeta ligniaria NRRL 30616]
MSNVGQSRWYTRSVQAASLYDKLDWTTDLTARLIKSHSGIRSTWSCLSVYSYAVSSRGMIRYFNCDVIYFPRVSGKHARRVHVRCQTSQLNTLFRINVRRAHTFIFSTSYPMRHTKILEDITPHSFSGLYTQQLVPKPFPANRPPGPRYEA